MAMAQRMSPFPASVVGIVVVLLLVGICELQAFSPQLSNHGTPHVGPKEQFGFKSRETQLFAAEDDMEDDEDDDEDIDTSNLGDWRKFRASLIDSGLPTKEDEESEATPAVAKKKKPRKDMAEKNKELLKEQNAKLAQEEVWAHIVPEPEVGGLLCRMPLEAEIFWGGEGYWKERLATELALGFGTVHVSAKDEDLDEEDAKWQSKVACWYQTAERMIQQEIKRITSSGKVKNGILDPNDLEENERNLMDRYLKSKQTWQETCLLLSHSPETGESESLVINRPISRGINKQLAQMLLEGGDESGKDKYGYDFGDRFVQAFSKDGVVYNGGPNGQSEPAMLIHGISDLPGATELAPGTGIYKGGVVAAVEGILEGKYQPLEFRFFLGKQTLNPKEHPERGALLGKIKKEEYKPVACSRNLALKQCLGLPKPLWHEVLELCGGELKALSNVELKKRVDLK